MEPTSTQGIEPADRSHTWDDFVDLDEDDPRELIDGELIEVEMATQKHEWIVACLVTRLKVWADANRAGRPYASGYKVRIDKRRGVMPDVQFFRRGNSANRNEQGVIEGRPDLVVEVLSPSSRGIDRLKKLKWYAQIAVPEYWVVDPDIRSVERLVLGDGVYRVVDGVEGDAVFAPESFPGLEIPLAELWKAPDAD